jgi:glucose/arabinose dehydrogenase
MNMNSSPHVLAGVAVDKAGAPLVADDVGNVVWRVVPANAR